MDNTLQSIVNEKLSAMALAEKLFKEAMAQKDEALKKIIQEWLASLSIVDGKIDRAANKKILNKLNAALTRKINKKELASPVKKLLKEFDTTENYTKKILELENSVDLSKYDLSEEKKMAVQEIVDGLLNDDVLKAELVNPLKKIAFRHVTTGITFQNAQKEFEKHLDGNPFSKYARQVTFEAISRYDGMINQRVANDFKLDAFRIVGSLIATSQPVCIHMIKESGPFAGMAINGKYPIKELPAIIRIVNTFPGAVPGTNESNYFINRNHWGCRHVFIPTRFTSKDLDGLPRAIYVDIAENDFKNVPPNLADFEKEKQIFVNRDIFSYLKRNFTLSISETGGAYYDFSNEIVSIPRDKDGKSNLLSLYHEIGHVIDWQHDLRKNPDFKKFFNQWKKHYSERELSEISDSLWEEGYKAYEEKRYYDAKMVGVPHDVIKALNIRYGSGHSDEYFRNEGFPEAEFIAHMFSVKYGENPYFEKYMPDLYKAMKDYKIPIERKDP